jgi:hypothetical protein
MKFIISLSSIFLTAALLSGCTKDAVKDGVSDGSNPDGNSSGESYDHYPFYEHR